MAGANQVGLLVMAHGGSDEWNGTVAAVVAPLREALPTAVAFGMADPKTLEAGLDSLRLAGVTHVAVVRMFISGQSFLGQTKYLLGLSDAKPEFFIRQEPAADSPTEIVPVSRGLILATHETGLMVSREAKDILTDRAQSASRRPEGESVLLLAHGMGADSENEKVVYAMDSISTALRKVGFASVSAATLREDWDEKRVIVEPQIRDYVSTESAAGRRVIVVPMRLYGFGPYAEVLSGLDYTPTEGLLPHPAISDWIRNTASEVICEAGWRSPFVRCSTEALAEN
jgi:sirohydrochlorin ferrochelatase